MTAFRNLAITTLCLGAVSAMCSAPASAAILFQDDFETATSGAKPNSPQTGVYPSLAPLIPESNVVTAGGSHASAPGAGSKLLYVIDKQRNYFPAAATGLGTVRYELDVRLNTSATAFSMGFTGDSGAVSLDSRPTPIWLQFTNTGLIQAYSTTGSWQTIAGISHTPGQWQHYVLEYELGATEFSLTAGANTALSSRFNATTSAAAITNAFANGGASSTFAYVDNVSVTFVPEPAAFSLLLIGSGAILRRRGRVSPRT